MTTTLSKLLASLIASLGLLIAGAALAHEGHEHGSGDKVKGTIKALTDKTLVITTTDGKDVTLDVMEMTKFERSGKATTAADVAVGEKAVVTSMKGGPSGAHAMLVKLGAKAAAKGAATAKTSSADAGMSADGGAKTLSPNAAAKTEEHGHHGH